MMNQNILVGRGMNRSGAVSITLSLLLVFGQVGNLVVQAQGRQTAKKSALTGDQRIAHVLSRLTFGARPGDFERVKAVGVDEFIRQQLDSDSLDDVAVQARLRRLPTLGMATPVIFEQYTPPKPVDAMQKPEESRQKQEAGTMPALPAASPRPTPPPKNPQMVVTELQRAALLRAVYSERQLYELMVGFWENHFSIFANKDDDRYLLTSYDRDTIRPFAMGRFRDLLGATGQRGATRAGGQTKIHGHCSQVCAGVTSILRPRHDRSPDLTHPAFQRPQDRDCSSGNAAQLPDAILCR